MGSLPLLNASCHVSENKSITVPWAVSVCLLSFLPSRTRLPENWAEAYSLPLRMSR